jgi:hypothetical protein
MRSLVVMSLEDDEHNQKQWGLCYPAVMDLRLLLTFTGDGKELIGDQNAEEVVVLSDDQKVLCLKRGFEIYEVMKLQGVPPNEATFTAVARLAVAKGDGDLAFDMVKQMAEAKITPR